MTKNNIRKVNKQPRWIFLVSVIGGVLGWLFPGVYRYFRRLFQQPFFSMQTIPPPRTFENLEPQAYQIAVDNLRAGIEVRFLPDGHKKLVLCAGLRNFREPWARDFGFACFGLLEIQEYQTTHDSLELFFHFQNPTGQFPVKVHSTSVIDRFMHSLFGREQPIDRPLRPKYITAHNTISLDGNALMVIAALNYARQADEPDFAKQNWKTLKRAMDWLAKNAIEDDCLLSQGAFTDWADTVARQGKILYTNVIYWKALSEMATAALIYGFKDDAQTFHAKADQVKAAINSEFWRDDLGYFITSRVFDNLSSSGNLLAIAWQLTSAEQADRILNAMRYYAMASPVPTKAVHRAYPKKFIALENRVGGIADYHTYFAWLWIGAWHVIALTRMERLEEARELIYRIARVIVRDGKVHEVYAPSGHYASSFWYTSEAPLTWSAGMVVHAVNVYQRHIQGKEAFDDVLPALNNKSL